MRKMLNVLVLNAPNYPPSEPSILIEPVDTLTLATWIQHRGHKVAFIDIDRHGMHALLSETQSFDLALMVFDYYIPLHRTAAIGTFKDVFSLLSNLTELVLLVGSMATYRPHDMLSMFPVLDGCVLGEAEPVLSALFASKDFKQISKIDNIITRENQHQERVFWRPRVNSNIYIDDIPLSGPIANRALCRVEDYIDVRSIISSRGCSGNCTFCSTVGYWGAWRGASPELVLSEMRHLKANGAYKIIFLDDNFANNPKRVSTICKLLKRYPIDCVWGCLCRIDDVSKQLLEYMVAVGCRWIHFGIEHGSPEVRARIGKRFTNKQALEVIQFAKSLGLRIRTSWILDLPGTTIEDTYISLDFARILGSHEIKLHFLAIRPGSRLYQMKHGNSEAKENKRGQSGSFDEIFIHTGLPHNTEIKNNSESIVELLQDFRREMDAEGYQWVDDVTFWQQFNDREAAPDERFISTTILRYGLGWI